jgi:hypothetical protein
MDYFTERLKVKRKECLYFELKIVFSILCASFECR